MSAEHDQAARPAGRGASGRSGPWDVPEAADGSAWDDLSATDASAWDDEPAAPDDRPAAAAGAPGRHVEPSVWDDDRPVPSAWEDAPERSAWDDVREQPAWQDASGRAPDRPTPTEHAPATGTTVAERPSARSTPRPTVRPTAAELAERVAEILARPTGDRPTPARRASGAGARSAGTRDVGDVPSDEGDADPAPGPSRSRPGAGGPRPARGRRRAPAGEPPSSGPAATDAEPDPESVARSVALRLLTGAPRSRAQLAEAMARKDVPEEVAERVLDRFTDVGLVDDSAYAEMLVRTRHAERGMSRRGIAQELRRRGVDEVTARDALAQVDDEDEERAARALARKKLSTTRGLDRETRLRRAYGALGRKGYGGELVARVVREELAAEGADLDD